MATDESNLESGHGTERVYFVEVRSTTGPQHIGKWLLTDKWLRVWFDASPSGLIHPGPLVNPQALRCGYVDFEAAEALAACFRAQLSERGFRPYGVETRIVVVRFEYDFKSERVGEGDSVTERELKQFPLTGNRVVVGGAEGADSRNDSKPLRSECV